MVRGAHAARASLYYQNPHQNQNQNPNQPYSQPPPSLSAAEPLFLLQVRRSTMRATACRRVPLWRCNNHGRRWEVRALAVELCFWLKVRP